MRESEFWGTVDWVFPHGRGKSLTSDLVLSSLGNRSPQNAIDAGVAPQEVWIAICDAMELPETYHYLHRVKAEDREQLK